MSMRRESLLNANFAQKAFPGRTILQLMLPQFMKEKDHFAVYFVVQAFQENYILLHVKYSVCRCRTQEAETAWSSIEAAISWAAGGSESGNVWQ